MQTFEKSSGARRTAPLMVNVVTVVVATDEIESERLIDLCNDRHRLWLGKHAFWALANGRGIEQYPE